MLAIIANDIVAGCVVAIMYAVVGGFINEGVPGVIDVVTVLGLTNGLGYNRDVDGFLLSELDVLAVYAVVFAGVEFVVRVLRLHTHVVLAI